MELFEGGNYNGEIPMELVVFIERQKESCDVGVIVEWDKNC